MAGLLERFATRHLLTWLEALSSIGRMDTAYTSPSMIRWQSQFSDTPASTV